MANDNSARGFIFSCEWRDDSLNLAKPLQLAIYPADSSVEIADLVHRKLFLKRTVCQIPNVIQPGGHVKIMGRRLEVLDYADDFTRINWTKRFETCVVMVNENERDLFQGQGGGWMNEWLLCGPWRLEDARTIIVSEMDAAVLECRPGIYYRFEFRCDQGCLVKYFEEFQQRLGSSLKQSIIVQPRLETKSLPAATVNANNCTCVIIKPHVFEEQSGRNAVGVTGQLLTEIAQAGFSITDMRVHHFTPKQAEDFLEIYRTVLPDFNEMVGQLASGKSLCLEVISKGETVKEFRKLAGPHDPELARRVNANSLRAKYGTDFVRNAIHCSDLEEDGELEVNFIFSMLN